MNTKNIKINLWLVVCLITINCFSQSLIPPTPMPNIIPPSPTVASLMYFEELPVDHYSGQPDISIPLYTKKLNSELSLPLQVRYSTLGLREGENPGWTGRGWSLEAGGVISRTVRGSADEAKRTAAIKNIGIFFNDYWNFASLTPRQQNRFLWNANGTKDTVMDIQPDLFQYSFLGKSGRFMLKSVNGSLVPVMLSQDENIKIELIADSNKIISMFAITDANGYKYIFSAIETTVTTPTVFITSQKNLVSPAENIPLQPTINTAWHLTRVEQPDGIILATFTYNTVSETYNPQPTEIYNEIVNHPTVANPLIDNGYNTGFLKPKKIVTYYEITTQTRKLSQIVFRDNTKIELSTSNGYLDLINVKDNLNNVAKKFKFGIAQNGINSLVIDDIEKYRFTYYSDILTPAGIDGWGYKSGDYRNDPDKGYNFYNYNCISIGVLTQITYPTGGVRKFNWEPNTFSYEGNTPLTIQDFDKNPTNVMNMTPFTTSISGDIHGTSSILGTSQFTINHAQNVLLNINITSVTSVVQNARNLLQIEFRRNGSTTSIQPIRFIDLTQNPSKKLVFLEAGTYKCAIKVIPGQALLDPIAVVASATVSYSQKKVGSNYANMVLGGGLRIESIESLDPIASPALKGKSVYNYDIEVPDGTGDPLGYKKFSSGSVDARLGNMYRNHIEKDLKVVYGGTENTTASEITIEYKVTSSERNSQLTKGNYVGYKRVRVFETLSPHIIGLAPQSDYTEYTYTSPQDFPLSDSPFNYPYPTVVNIDYKRGLLLSNRTFKNGKVAEETLNDINDYQFIDSPDTEENSSYIAIDIKPTLCKWRQFYEHYDSYIKAEWLQYPMLCGVDDEGMPRDCMGGLKGNCSGGNFLAPYAPIIKTIRKSRVELRKSTFKQYFYDGATANTIQKTTDYEYDPINYQLKKETHSITEGSSTKAYKTEYEYPTSISTTSLLDTNDLAVIQKMKDLNILNKPIITSFSINNVVQQRSINQYKEFIPNQILSGSVKSWRYLSSTANSTEEQIKYEKYNNSGNIEQVRRADGLAVSYIWAYNNTVPVAKLENIEYNNIPPDLIEAIAGATNESLLGTALANLHDNYESNSSVQVTTTLIENPANGLIKEVVDPKGDVFKYQYDALGRLIRVRDSQDRILSENVYNLRPQ
mgnify:CR=1 FL=1